MKSTSIYQLGWFSTGRDKAARDLLQAVYSGIKQGEIKAEIAFVFSNHELGESKESDLFFKLVEDYQIPLICFSHKKFKASKAPPKTVKVGTLPPWRLEYDREVLNRLQSFHPDLCVLAGYMLIIGKEMCRRYNMINLHPAAPGGPSLRPRGVPAAGGRVHRLLPPRVRRAEHRVRAGSHRHAL